MSIIKNIDEIVGNTPLLELSKIKSNLNLGANLYAKLEFLNPAGSIKDRASLFMVNQAEKDGLITKGATIIEPTSGNTGIGLAMIGASRGYKVILTMPDTMSVERINILKSYGAQVVLTNGKLGMQGAIDKANEIKENTPNSFIPSQFSNPANVLAHYQGTGPEIYRDLQGKVDVFVAGIGTGATLSGIAKYLKEQNPNVVIVGIEPEDSPLITKGTSGTHGIQGIGANFIPENFYKGVCDYVLTCPTGKAIEYAKMLSRLEGLSVGISSGANVYIATKLAEKDQFKAKNIVTVLPDSASRYYSTDLFKF